MKYMQLKERVSRSWGESELDMEAKKETIVKKERERRRIGNNEFSSFKAHLHEFHLNNLVFDYVNDDLPILHDIKSI